MHVQIDRQTYPESLASDRARVKRALADVRRGVADWKDMVSKAHQISDELAETHADMSASCHSGSTRFFRLAANDHFTFLGYREYVIEDSDEGRCSRLSSRVAGHHAPGAPQVSDSPARDLAEGIGSAIDP